MALLNRVLQRGPRATAPVEDQRMSVIEHLEALRRMLIISLIAWGVATIAAVFVARDVITFLILRAGIGHAIYLQPGGGVLLQLKVALYIGIVLAAPVIIQQVWWFVSPGLHPHERRYVLPLVVATIVFFAIGVSVAMFALPLYIKILGSLAGPVATAEVRARRQRACRGLMPDRDGAHARVDHSQRRGPCADAPSRQRPGLDHGRVLDASPRHTRPRIAGVDPGPVGRTDA